MDDKIINIADYRGQHTGSDGPDNPDGESWVFDISVFAKDEMDVAGTITDFSDAHAARSQADRLRKFFYLLNRLSWNLWHQAYEMEKSDDDRLLCVVHIYESSRVHTHTHMCVESDEQFSWMQRRLADAYRAITGEAGRDD